jgi:hypothetical protein
MGCIVHPLGQVPMYSRTESVLTRWSCAVWGHHVDNRVFGSATDRGRVCRCGSPYLARDGSATHVRHTLSCFLGHHTYVGSSATRSFE